MFHKYPYSNFHELNLDWILSKINEFQTKLDEWAVLAEELRQALDQIEGIQEEIDTINNSIDNIYNIINNLHLDEIITDIAKLRTSVSILTNKDIDLQNQIDNIQDEFKVVNSRFNQLYVYVDGMIAKVYAYVNENDAIILAKMNQMKLQLLEMIQELQKEIDELDTSVINPWHPERGEISLKDNIKYIYADLADNVPTAEEYSSLGLTADAYNTFELSAIKYSKFGRKILHLDWVFSPVYGFKQNISNVLTSIVNHFSKTYTADEYTSLDLTADDYTALNLTALQYYSFNQDRAGVYLVNGILQSNQYALYENDGVGSVTGAEATLTDGVISFN